MGAPMEGKEEIGKGENEMFPTSHCLCLNIILNKISLFPLLALFHSFVIIFPLSSICFCVSSFFPSLFFVQSGTPLSSRKIGRMPVRVASRLSLVWQKNPNNLCLMIEVLRWEKSGFLLLQFFHFFFFKKIILYWNEEIFLCVLMNKEPESSESESNILKMTAISPSAFAPPLSFLLFLYPLCLFVLKKDYFLYPQQEKPQKLWVSVYMYANIHNATTTNFNKQRLWWIFHFWLLSSLSGCIA